MFKFPVGPNVSRKCTDTTGVLIIP